MALDPSTEEQIKAMGFLVNKANAERDAVIKALSASVGYLLNAKIDLETGATKATAVKTIEGGISMAREALAKAGAR